MFFNDTATTEIYTGILAIAGCQKPEMDVNESISGDKFVITATLSVEGADTRTQMVPGNDANSYKVEWQAGDAIQTNGNTSTEINISASNASSATFTFDGGVFDAPYYAVYPASAASGFENNKYTVTLPEEQIYAGSDKFAPQSALMLGYSATSGNVAFKHAMAYIRLTLTSGENPIKSVKLESINQEALSGSFTAVCTDGIWTMSEGSTASVTLNCGAEGAAIGEKMLIAIPADTYEGGLTVTVTDTKNHYMARKATNSFTAEMGGIYDMAFEFVAQGTVVEGNIDINTVDDWTAFAKAVTDGDTYEGKTITLQSNLTVDTYFEYANGTFEGTFDGNGKTMTANGNKWPLFATVGTKGVVKNITMDGKFTTFVNPGEAGNATIAKINLGLIQDVTNRSDVIDLTITDGVAFGSIVGQNGGTLRRVHNEGIIKLKAKSSTTSTSSNAGTFALYGGGLCAIGHTTSGDPVANSLNTDDKCKPGNFEYCTNSGDIEITVTKGTPVRSGIGGICGVVYFNGVKFSNCENTGNISRTSDGENSNNGSVSIGGILGRSAGWFTTGNGSPSAFDDGINDDGSETGVGFDTEYTLCTNEGALYCKCRHSGALTYNNRIRRSDNVGGIVGLAVGAQGKIQTISDCTNTGTLTGGWSSDTNAASLGGVAGYATYTELSGCTSICKFNNVDETRAIGAAGGLIGYVVKEVTIKNQCISVPTMDIYGKNTTNFLYGLVIGNINISASIESVSVAGSIKQGIAKGTQTEISITSDTYANYLISANSNAKLTSPVTTWYSAN